MITYLSWMYKVQRNSSYQPDFLSQWNLCIKITSQYIGLELAKCLSIHHRSDHMASLSLH